MKIYVLWRMFPFEEKEVISVTTSVEEALNWEKDIHQSFESFDLRNEDKG